MSLMKSRRCIAPPKSVGYQVRSSKQEIVCSEMVGPAAMCTAKTLSTSESLRRAYRVRFTPQERTSSGDAEQPTIERTGARLIALATGEERRYHAAPDHRRIGVTRHSHRIGVLARTNMLDWGKAQPT
jgi:hypothetical protein